MTKNLIPRRRKKSDKKASAGRTLFIENLEPRVLFSASPVVDVNTNQPDPDLGIAGTVGSGNDGTEGATAGANSQTADPDDPNYSPNVAAGQRNEEMVNEHVDFNISFDNAGDMTGYAPYIDLILDVGLDVDVPFGDFGPSDSIQLALGEGNGVPLQETQVLGLALNTAEIAKLAAEQGSAFAQDWFDLVVNDVANYVAVNDTFDVVAGVNAGLAQNVVVPGGFDIGGQITDDGNGILLEGGNAVGTIDYATGQFSFTTATANAGAALTYTQAQGSNFWSLPDASGSPASLAAAAPDPAAFAITAIGHPLDDVVVLDANDLQHGQNYFVVKLPFGSFTEGQSPTNIRVTARLDQEPFGDASIGAQPDDPQNIVARGGFALGNDPANNPGADPAIRGDVATDEIIPKVVELLKRGPDDLVSGPSNLHTFELQVDLAAGERFEDLVITDFIPDDLVYVPNSVEIIYRDEASQVPVNVQILQPGDVNNDNYASQIAGWEANDETNDPGGTLQLIFGEVSGVSNADGMGGFDPDLESEFATEGEPNILLHDITIRYQLYAPEFAGVAGTRTVPVNGTGDEQGFATSTENVANLEGTWTNAEGQTIAVADDDTGEGDDRNRYDSDHDIGEIKPAATEKDSTRFFDANGNLVVGREARPGDIVEYTLNFSISDFDALSNFRIEDYLGDGLSYFENDVLNVGDPALTAQGISTFQSYWALRQGGENQSGQIDGSPNFSDVQQWFAFGGPSITTDTTYTQVNPDFTNTGRDLLTWHLSTEVSLAEGQTDTVVFDETNGVVFNIDTTGVLAADINTTGAASVQGALGGLSISVMHPAGIFTLTPDPADPTTLISMDIPAGITVTNTSVNFATGAVTFDISESWDVTADLEYEGRQAIVGQAITISDDGNDTVVAAPVNGAIVAGSFVAGAAGTLTPTVGAAIDLNIDSNGILTRADNGIAVGRVDTGNPETVVFDNPNALGAVGAVTQDYTLDLTFDFNAVRNNNVIGQIVDGDLVVNTNINGTGINARGGLVGISDINYDRNGMQRDIVEAGGNLTGPDNGTGTVMFAGRNLQITYGEDDYTYDVDANYDVNYRFGALVNGDIDGDGALDFNFDSNNSGTDDAFDWNEDLVADVSLDVNGDGLLDGWDTDGDGTLDMYHYLAGGLFDTQNTGATDVTNPNANSNGDGYFVYYDTNGNFVDGREALNRNIPPTDDVELRFYAQIDTGFVDEGSTGTDSGVNLDDTLFNDSFIVGDAIQEFDQFGANNETLPSENGNRFRDRGFDFFDIERAAFDKFLVGLDTGNGLESILDRAAQGDTLFDNENTLGEAGADGNVDNPTLGIGDRAVYRLRLQMPFASVEDLTITDFLPLPVFDLSSDYPNGTSQLLNGDGTAFSYTGDANFSAQILDDQGNLVQLDSADGLGNAIYWFYGPDHSVTPAVVNPEVVGNPQIDQTLEFDAAGGASTVSFDQNANSIVWNFGSLEEVDDGDPDTNGAVIDILFVVEVNSQTFTDGLSLTNQGESSYRDSRDENIATVGLVQVELQSPDVKIRKGVIAVSPASNGADGPSLLGGNGDLPQLDTTGANAEFAAFGQTDHLTNPFGSQDFDPTTAEATINGESIGNLIDGQLNAFLDTSNVVAGSVNLEINQYGQLLTLTDDGAGAFTIDAGSAAAGNFSLNSATINYQSGEIALDFDVTSPVAVTFDRFDTTNDVVGETAPIPVSDNVPTITSIAATGAIVPGSITMTVQEAGGAVITDRPNAIPSGQTTIPSPDGRLYTTNAGGFFVEIGQVDYSTGDFVFTINTVTSAPALSIDYSQATTTASANANTTALDGAVANFDVNANNAAPNIVAGTVRATLGSGANQVVLVESIGQTGDPDGFLYVEGGNGAIVGVIDYDTGVISFDAVETLAGTATTYDVNAGPGIITSEYIHGVADFTAVAQEGVYSNFIDSNALDVDSGDVVTFGVFVENVGAGTGFDLKISDQLLDGFDQDIRGLLAGSEFDGAVTTADFIAATNFRIFSGTGTELVAGTDFFLDVNTGTTETSSTASLNFTGNETIALANPGVDILVPGTLRIEVEGNAIASVGTTAHELVVTDVPLFTNQGVPTGSGDLQYFDPVTGLLTTVGTIDYSTRQIAWAAPLQDSDANAIGTRAAVVTYDSVPQITETLDDALANGAFLGFVDQTNLVAGATRAEIDLVGDDTNHIGLIDNGAGQFIIDPATSVLGSLTGVVFTNNTTITHDNGTIVLNNRDIDYATGRFNLSVTDTWDVGIAYDLDNAAPTAVVNQPAPATIDDGINSFNLGNTNITAGSVSIHLDDTGAADSNGADFGTDTITDDGGGLLILNNGNEVGTINYATGEVSFAFNVTGAAQINAELNYTHSAAPASSTSEGDLDVRNGELLGGPINAAGATGIRPGTVVITDEDGLHASLIDDGAGNILLNDGSGRIFGAINYVTGEIDFNYAEFQDIEASYATTNLFQVTFNDDRDGNLANGQEGILAGGRNGGDEFVTNERGDNVLVITYDLEVTDDWRPSDELTNQASINAIASSDGGANLLVNTESNSLEREQDIATVTGRDIGLDKFLLSTDQEHTGAESFTVRSIDYENGFATGQALLTVNTPSTESHVPSNFDERTALPISNSAGTNGNLTRFYYPPGSVTVPFAPDTGFVENPIPLATGELGTVLQLVTDSRNADFRPSLHGDNTVNPNTGVHDETAVGRFTGVTEGVDFSDPTNPQPDPNSALAQATQQASVYTISNFPAGDFSRDQNNTYVVVDPGGPNEIVVRAFRDIAGNNDRLEVVSGTAAGLAAAQVAVGDTVGFQEVNPGEPTNLITNTNRQLQFITNINPTGAGVALNYYYYENTETASVYSNVPQNVANDWTSNFTFSISQNEGNGNNSHDIGQGFAFIIQNDPLGASAHGNRTFGLNSGTTVNPHISVRFETFENGNGNNLQRLRLEGTGLQQQVINDVFDFEEAVFQNLLDATGTQATSFDVQINYDSLAQELRVELIAVGDAAALALLDLDNDGNMATGTLNGVSDASVANNSFVHVFSNVNIANSLNTGEAFVGFGAENRHAFNPSAAFYLNDWTFDAQQSDDNHHGRGVTAVNGAAIDAGTDATVGEVVEYAIVVDVPEGSVDHLTVTDFFPEGLELLGVSIITLSDDSVTDDGNRLLAENFNGTVPAFTVDIGGSTNLDPASISAADGFVGGTDLIFRFEDVILNPATDPQDDDPNDVADVLNSAQDNKFIIRVQARVMNGVDFDPLANGINTADSGVDDANANAESVEGGNIGVETNLDNNAFENADNHVDLLNTASVTFQDHDDGAIETTAARTGVEIDVVEPQLKVDKVLVNFSTPQGPNDQVDLDDTVTYTVTISHTSLADGDPAQSTADAFNINFFDDLTNTFVSGGFTSNPLGTNFANITQFEILDAPSYINDGAPVVLFDSDGTTTEPGTVTGLSTTLGDPNLDFSAIATNQLSLNFDRLVVGDEIVLSYTVRLNGDQALENVNLDADGHDIINEAVVTYYSVGELDNPEVRESQVTDDAALTALGPDVDLRLVKGILALNGETGAATFTSDADSAGVGAVGDPLNPQPIVVTPVAEENLGVTAVHFEVGAALGADLNTASAATPVSPGTVVITFGDPADATRFSTQVGDFYGDGNLYNLNDIDAGIIGAVNYQTGELNFDIRQEVEINYEFSAVNSAILDDDGVTLGAAPTALSQQTLRPGSVEVTLTGELFSGVSTLKDINGNGLLFAVNAMDNILGASHVGVINYSDGEITLVAAADGGATNGITADVDSFFFANGSPRVGEDLTNATDGAMPFTFTGQQNLTPGSVSITTGNFTLRDFFSDGRLFVVDTAGDAILLDATGAVTTDPTAAVSVGDVDYVNGGAVFTLDPTVPAYRGFAEESTISVNYSTFTNGGGVNLTSAYLHPDLTDLTQWNELIDRNVLEANGGVASGDVITFGIVVENLGKDAAYDINLSDGLVQLDAGGNPVNVDWTGGDLTQATPADLAAFAQAINLNVQRGNGENLDFVLTYDAASGDFRIAVTDPSENDAALSAGAQTRGGVPNNVFGDNVLLVTYDVTVLDSFEAGDYLGNTATVDSFAFADESVAQIAVGITDDAIIEGQTLAIQKHILTTDLPATDDATISTTLDASNGQTVLSNPGSQAVVPGSLTISGNGVNVTTDTAGNLNAAISGEVIPSTVNTALPLAHQNVTPGSVSIATTLGGQAITLTDDGAGLLNANFVNLTLPNATGSSLGTINLANTNIAADSLVLTITEGSVTTTINDVGGDLIQTAVFDQNLVDGLGNPAGSAVGNVNFSINQAEPGSLVLDLITAGGAVVQTFTDDAGLDGNGAPRADGTGRLLSSFENIQLHNTFGSEAVGYQIPTNIRPGSLTITYFDGEPTTVTAAANGQLSDGSGSVNYATGEVTFDGTPIANPSLANVVISYTQEVATIDYDTGVISVTSAFNPDNFTVQATYNLDAANAIDNGQIVGSIDLVNGTVTFDHIVNPDSDTITASYGAEVGAVDYANGTVTLNSAFGDPVTTSYEAGIGTVDFQTGVLTYTTTGNTPEANAAVAFQQTIPNVVDTGVQNVTYGEVVTFGLEVTVPEGTTNGLVVSDILPDGFEILSVEIVRSATDARLSGQLDADYAGDPLNNITVSDGTTNLTLNEGTVTDVAGTLQNGTLTFTFNDPVLNQTDADSTNDSFFILVNARVLNNLDFNPAANGVDPADSGVADLDPNAENTQNGNAVGEILVNDSSLTFTDGGGADLGLENIAGNTVSVEIVAPALVVDKTAEPNPVGIGGELVFTVNINHDGTSNADAYFINVRDNLTEQAFATPTGATAFNQGNFTSVTLTRSTQANGGSSETATINIATGQILGDQTLVDDLTNDSEFTLDTLDVTLRQLALGDTLTVEYIVQVGVEDSAAAQAMIGDDSNTITPGTFDAQANTIDPGADFNNEAAVTYYNLEDLTNPEVTETVTEGVASAEVFLGPDLAITKTDGRSALTIGQTTVYTLTVENRETHIAPLVAGADGSQATGVLVTDVLPVFLDFDPTNPEAIIITDAATGAPINAIDVTATGNPPGANQYTVVLNPDGTTTIQIGLGSLNHTDDVIGADHSNLVMIDVQATVNALVPTTPGSITAIINTATVTSDAGGDLTPLDNIARDVGLVVFPLDAVINQVEDVLQILAPEAEAGLFPLFGGADIFQGFRFAQSTMAMDELNFGIEQEDEQGRVPPMLTMMPMYSGLADPGTVLNIRILGQFGESMPNGEQTVVADAGGNWAATFPGLVLFDSPHIIIIEQTAPSWETSDDHGYNLRTYFAPLISPTHTQTEALTPDTVLGRRLTSVAIDSIAEGSADTADLEDWRLGNFENAAQSGIAGVLQ